MSSAPGWLRGPLPDSDDAEREAAAAFMPPDAFLAALESASHDGGGDAAAVAGGDTNTRWWDGGPPLPELRCIQRASRSCCRVDAGARGRARAEQRLSFSHLRAGAVRWGRVVPSWIARLYDATLPLAPVPSDAAPPLITEAGGAGDEGAAPEEASGGWLIEALSVEVTAAAAMVTGEVVVAAQAQPTTIPRRPAAAVAASRAIAGAHPAMTGPDGRLPSTS